MIGLDAVTLVVAVCSGVASMATGIAVGAWYASAKNSKINQHTEAIKEINTRCNQQRATMLKDLEKSICAGIKAALADLDNAWLQRNTETREDIAALKATVQQHGDDLREIFTKLDKEKG